MIPTVTLTVTCPYSTARLTYHYQLSLVTYVKEIGTFTRIGSYHAGFNFEFLDHFIYIA